MGPKNLPGLSFQRPWVNRGLLPAAPRTCLPPGASRTFQNIPPKATLKSTSLALHRAGEAHRPGRGRAWVLQAPLGRSPPDSLPGLLGLTSLPPSVHFGGGGRIFPGRKGWSFPFHSRFCLVLSLESSLPLQRHLSLSVSPPASSL